MLSAAVADYKYPHRASWVTAGRIDHRRLDCGENIETGLEDFTSSQSSIRPQCTVLGKRQLGGAGGVSPGLVSTIRIGIGIALEIYDQNGGVDMKKILTGLMITLAAGLFTTGTAEAQRSQRYAQDSFRVQLGEFRPDGDSVYWTDSELDFTGRTEDFEDSAAGLSYLHPLGPKLSLQVSGFFYEGIQDQAYRAFEDQFGGDILHTTELELTSVTIGLLYRLAGPDAAVLPYVGAGGGLYSWRLSEFGDFIDFSGADLEIFEDFFEQEDEELGWYFTAGLEVPIADSWSVFAEGRWDNAEAELGGDFRGLGELDLSGRSYSAGISWRF